MKKIGFVVLLVAFIALLSGTAMAQEQPASKKIVFELSVMGLTCDADAAKLDQFLMGRKGIQSSQTSFTSKRVKVVADSFVTLMAVRNVIVAAGFEMSEENIVQTELN